MSTRLAPPAAKLAFSLVELSIVLVILGLLVGGVLSGRSLIQAAELRAQMKQIESYNIAVRTFQDKYLALPGDMALVEASRFNFYRDGTNGQTATGCDSTGSAGCGDGNGQIRGIVASSEQQSHQLGEPHLFWLDLTKSGLIGENITIAVNGGLFSTDVRNYLPQAKIKGLFVYVWANGVAPDAGGATPSNNDGRNYLTVASVPQFLGPSAAGSLESLPRVKVIDAFGIDKKIDDGLPQTGGVTAVYIGVFSGQIRARWIDSAGVAAASTAALAASSSTCYDNNNTAGQPREYSLSASTATNCALSFVMR